MFVWFVVYLIIFHWLFRFLTGKRSNSLGCLKGKTAIVTGGNSGIGYAASLLLASRGCRIIIADVENSDVSREAIKKQTGNEDIITKYLNLASFKSVREFAEDIEKTEKKIDILLNIAGVSYSTEDISEDGLNPVLQINFFGSFLLTHLLINSLKASGSGRIIFTGSTLAFFHNSLLETLSKQADKTFWLAFYRYGNSKMCNILAAQEFGRRLRGHGITANSFDPGCIRTKIFNIPNVFNITFWCSINIFVNTLVRFIGRSPLIGAQTCLHLASSTELERETGQHYFLCRRWFKPRILNNEDYVDKIWSRTEELVKLKPEEKLNI